KLISIIVPVYNAEQYLSACLGSIRRQTYDNLEIILVNDGATDRSGEICEQFAQKDQRFKIYHEVNRGVGSARNIALRKVTGYYITFIDSDDTVHPDYISELYQTAKAQGSDIVCSGYNYISQNL